MSTNAKRKALLAGVGVLLAVTVLTGNVLVLADRTVLDARFAKTTVEETGVHERLAEDLRGNVGGGEAPVEGILTDQYVEEQIDANVDRLYGYLHGDRDQLRLYFELEPIKAEMAREVAAENDEVDRETARARLDEEMPDTHDFTEGMDAESESNLETARSVVSILDVLVYVVPLFGLALAGGFARAAPTRETAAYGVGAVVGVVGFLGVVVSIVAPGQVRSMLGGGSGADLGVAVLVNVVERVAGALVEQSLVLLLLGVVILAVGLALRLELLPAEWR